MITATAVGRLTNKPELRFTDNATPVASMTVATDNRRTEDGSSFLRVTIWGRAAENAAEHLVKGQRVAASGRLEQRHWQTDELENRSSWELTAHHVEYLDKPKGSATEAPKALVGEEEPF